MTKEHNEIDNWLEPPSLLTGLEDDVHVWRFYLDLPPEELLKLQEYLVQGEKTKAERYHFKLDRNRYIARRGLLRVILGRYLGIPPKLVDITLNIFGKPSVNTESGSVRFNLSHSHQIALIAITHKVEIGIDIEFISNDVDFEQISKSYFSDKERDTLQTLAPEIKTQAFFNCWTRKEAYIKARGEGLSFPLDKFTVSMLPCEQPRLLDVQGEKEEIDRWSFYQLTPAPDYTAALVVEGVDHRLRLWNGENLFQDRQGR